jgi:hypothetical protein
MHPVPSKGGAGAFSDGCGLWKAKVYKMAKYLRVRNFEKFQTFKDRTPLWFKFYVSVLDDEELEALPEPTELHLYKIWALAARMGNLIPNDAGWIGRKIGARSPVDLQTLILKTWLIESDGSELKPEPQPSRYIPDKLADEVFRRDRHKCVDCGATKNLEIGHVVPTSDGGKSELGNLAVRCRSCNRSKRACSGEERAKQLCEQEFHTAQDDATQLRSLEKRREEKRREDPPNPPSGGGDLDERIAGWIGQNQISARVVPCPAVYRDFRAIVAAVGWERACALVLEMAKNRNVVKPVSVALSRVAREQGIAAAESTVVNTQLEGKF